MKLLVPLAAGNENLQVRVSPEKRRRRRRRRRRKMERLTVHGRKIENCLGEEEEMVE